MYIYFISRYLYEEALPSVEKMFISEIDCDIIGDTYFPPSKCEEFVKEMNKIGRKGRGGMSGSIPNEKELADLVGKSLYDVWNKLCALIDEKYDMDCLWNKGGKAWKYEYKYRRGGKTLCALYARENCVGFMVILGKDERLKFEADRENYAKKVQELYDEARTYHDGKWIMFEPVDTSLFPDFMKLLGIKRKPNRK